MWILIKRQYKHFIYFGLLFIYLLSAYPVYSRFFVKTGKPEATIIQIPKTNEAITYSMVELRPVVNNGESLYELKGFAFLTSNPFQVNRITIILSLANKNLAFSTNSVPFPDMIKSYPGYKVGMDDAEFSMLLSDHVLSPGIYQVGVLLENLEGQDRSYVLTGSTIKKTPNTISFIPGP